MTAERVLVIGKIVGLYGVQGWVKLESYTEPRAKIFGYTPWRIESATVHRQIESAHGREQGKGLIGKIDGIDDRDAAAQLVGAEIRILRSQLPAPSDGEFYWSDLEGLSVVSLDGVELGRVSHLFSTGANDVVVVKDGDRERMIPFILGQFVREVDLKAGRVTVDWDADF